MKTLAFLLTLFFTSAHAEKVATEDMFTRNLNFSLHCTSDLKTMLTLISEEWNESPIMMSRQSEYVLLILFVNSELSTSTLVASRNEPNFEEACVIWTGESNGESFQVPALFSPPNLNQERT